MLYYLVSQVVRRGLSSQDHTRRWSGRDLILFARIPKPDGWSPMNRVATRLRLQPRSVSCGPSGPLWGSKIRLDSLHVADPGNSPSGVPMSSGRFLHPVINDAIAMTVSSRSELCRDGAHVTLFGSWYSFHWTAPCGFDEAQTPAFRPRSRRMTCAPRRPQSGRTSESPVWSPCSSVFRLRCHECCVGACTCTHSAILLGSSDPQGCPGHLHGAPDGVF